MVAAEVRRFQHVVGLLIVSSREHVVLLRFKFRGAAAIFERNARQPILLLGHIVIVAIPTPLCDNSFGLFAGHLDHVGVLVLLLAHSRLASFRFEFKTVTTHRTIDTPLGEGLATTDQRQLDRRRETLTLEGRPATLI